MDLEDIPAAPALADTVTTRLWAAVGIPDPQWAVGIIIRITADAVAVCFP